MTETDDASVASDRSSIFILVQQTDCKPVDPDFLLLDSQSTVNLFSNPNLVNNVRQATTPINVHCNKGTMPTTAVTDFGTNEVYLNPDGIANVLSLFALGQKHHITYDSKDRGGVFKVHTSEGLLEFTPTKKGLHALDLKTNPQAAHLLVTFNGAASRRCGHTGRGTRSVGDAGYTPSQITSWQGSGILGDFGRLASDLHQFMIPITARLLRTCGKGKGGSLKTYRRNHQRFPITLPPGEQDKKTRLFEELKALCDHPDPKQHPRNDWISAKTWRLVAHRTMLRRTGRLCRLGGHRMKRDIWNSLKDNRIARTKRASQSIEAKLRGGDVQEAFRLLKGWYRAATEVEARPCTQTMARQTEERIALYTRRTPP